MIIKYSTPKEINYIYHKDQQQGLINAMKMTIIRPGLFDRLFKLIHDQQWKIIILTILTIENNKINPYMLEHMSSLKYPYKGVFIVKALVDNKNSTIAVFDNLCNYKPIRKYMKKNKNTPKSIINTINTIEYSNFILNE